METCLKVVQTLKTFDKHHTFSKLIAKTFGNLAFTVDEGMHQ